MHEEKILDLLENISVKLENLDMRLNRLESSLINDESSKTKSSTKNASVPKSYKGVSGGIQLLVDNDFFNKPKSMREVFDELKREGYFHSLQSVDTTLRKTFVMRRKILSRISDEKIWKYAVKK